MIFKYCTESPVKATNGGGGGGGTSDITFLQKHSCSQLKPERGSWIKGTGVTERENFSYLL